MRGLSGATRAVSCVRRRRAVSFYPTFLMRDRTLASFRSCLSTESGAISYSVKASGLNSETCHYESFAASVYSLRPRESRPSSQILTTWALNAIKLPNRSNTLSPDAIPFRSPWGIPQMASSTFGIKCGGTTLPGFRTTVRLRRPNLGGTLSASKSVRVFIP